jgi:hypothetical protein
MEVFGLTEVGGLWQAEASLTYLARNSVAHMLPSKIFHLEA